jgi:CHAT domain-containing protein
MAAILLLVVLLSGLPAGAHELTAFLADPAGHARADKLAQALLASNGDVHDAAFMKLFMEDPNLSKRAFVAMIDYALDYADSQPQKAKTAFAMASALAELIGQNFADNRPKEILQALIASQDSSVESLIAYSQDLLKAKGAVQDGHYGANKTTVSDFPPVLWTALRPLFLKLIRAQYAIVLANPDLIVTELDSYPTVEANVIQSLVALGGDASKVDNEQMKDTKRGMDLRKLTVLAEVGLLDQFEKGATALLADESDNLISAAVHLTGFRAAARQNRLDLAQKHLRTAHEYAAKPGTEVDSVLEYSLRTADYQLRRLKGYRPTRSELLADFHQAWAALDGYKPLDLIARENNWYYGRLSTRYWLDELSRFPGAANQVGMEILPKIVSWVAALQEPRIRELLSGKDETLLRPGEFFGVMILAVSSVDQAVYILEAAPAMLNVPEMSNAVQELESLADVFVSLQSALGLDNGGPGFPPYDVESGGIIPELRARSSYLRALSEKTSAAERIAQLGKTVSLIKATKNPEVTVDYLIKAGRKLGELGQHEQAVGALKQALAIAEELSFVQRGLDASTLLAKEYSALGDWKNASLYADRAALKIQDTAPLMGVGTPESQALAAKTQQVTAISVKAAVAAQDPEKALAALTRSQQVQSAAVQMEGQKAAQADAREVAQKEEQVVALATEVKRLEEMPASGTRDELLKSTQSLLASTRAEFLADTRNLRQKYATLYTQVLRFDPLNLPDIQKSLPGDMAVVQYFPTEDGLYTFLVTHDAFRLRQVPVTKTALEESTKAYVRAIRRVQANDPIMIEESRKLYDALIAPIQTDIAGASTLVLIPSGRLNSLPFAGLAGAGGEPLGMSRRLLELAKPTDLMRISDEKPAPIDSVVAFANATGDLPAAGREGEQIAALFPKSKLFEGKEATKDAFVKFGGQAQALHLATHGEWNVENSLDNYLAMAGHQKVGQDEIFQLSLDNTSIVILSACNTAMGDSGDVRYVASLAEAFWIAGSRSVVASLWAVNDESTSLLMTELYKSLRAGDGKAEALRKAQKAVRSNPKFAHPYYWAGFILFGDWR